MVAGRHVEEIVGRIEVAGRQAQHQRDGGRVPAAGREPVLGGQFRVAREVAEAFPRILELRDPEPEQRVAQQELQPIAIERAGREEKSVRESTGPVRRKAVLQGDQGRVDRPAPGRCVDWQERRRLASAAVHAAAQSEAHRESLGGEDGCLGALGAWAPHGDAVVELRQGRVELCEERGVRRIGTEGGEPRVRAEVGARGVEVEARPCLDADQGHHGADRQTVRDPDFHADRRHATLGVNGEQAPAQARDEAGQAAGGAHVLLDAGERRTGPGAYRVAGQRPPEVPAAVRGEGVVPDHGLRVEREPHRAALRRIGALDGLGSNPARERGEHRQAEQESEENRSH